MAYLVDERGEDGAYHEQREDDRLHTSEGGLRVVKREPNEQTRHDSKAPFRNDILRHAPVLLEDSVRDDVDLEPEGHRELGVAHGLVLVFLLDGALLLMDAVDFVLDALTLGTLLPDVKPVCSTVVCLCVDDFDHVLCWILGLGTLASTVGLEVVEKSSRVVSNRTKVDRLATLC